MKKLLTVIPAAFLGLIGTIWLGQGIGVIPGSFMTGQVEWAVIGVVLIAASAALFWFAFRRRA